MKRMFLLFAILFAASAATAADYDEALKLYQEKKYDESLKTVTDALDAKRDREAGSPNYRLRFLAAHNHWKKGNIKAALSHFRRCAEIDKDTADPYIDAALMLIENRRFKDADSFIRKGRKVKDDPLYYHLWGRMAMANRNYGRAKELFEKAIALDPELYPSYNDLGLALMHLKKYSDANTAFAAAQSLSPSSGVVLNNLAISLEMQGKIKEAADALKKAQKAEPDNTAIFDNLSRVEKLLKK